MKKNYKILFYILAILAIAYGISYFANSTNNIWYMNLKKPLFIPPGIIFSIVWPILYVLMGISYFLIKEKKKTTFCKNLFIIQLILNFLWPITFFYFKNILLSIADIFLILIFLSLTILCFYKKDKKAAILLIPYFLWLIFATYLNIAIYFLNY